MVESVIAVAVELTRPCLIKSKEYRAGGKQRLLSEARKFKRVVNEGRDNSEDGEPIASTD